MRELCNCHQQSTYTELKNPFHPNSDSSALYALPNTMGISLHLGGVINSTYSRLKNHFLDHVICIIGYENIVNLKQLVVVSHHILLSHWLPHHSYPSFVESHSNLMQSGIIHLFLVTHTCKTYLDVLYPFMFVQIDFFWFDWAFVALYNKSRSSCSVPWFLFTREGAMCFFFYLDIFGYLLIFPLLG